MGTFLLQWKAISSSQFILRIVQQGYRLEFFKCPPEQVLPHGTAKKQRKGQRRSIGSHKRTNTIYKKVVSYVPQEEAGKGFYSHVFVVQKPSGKFRLILNLKPLKRVSHLQEVQDGFDIFCKGTTTPKLLYG